MGEVIDMQDKDSYVDLYADLCSILSSVEQISRLQGEQIARIEQAVKQYLHLVADTYEALQGKADK